MKIIKFTTLHVSQLFLLTGILELQKDALQKTNGEYAIYVTETDPNVVNCPICDIPYSDIINDQNIDPYDLYTKMLAMYGQDLVDIIVPRNDEVIETRVKNILDLVMDKVFKTDELEVIIYSNNPLEPNHRSTMAQLIRKTIYKYFNCISSEVNNTPHGYVTEERISISKKEG